MTFDIYNTTIQEACDYAVLKIVEQGGRCIDPNGFCAYSDEKGNHCAFGWLITDPKLKGVLKGVGTVDEILYKWSKLTNAEMPSVFKYKPNTNVMELLQEFHDLFNQSDRKATLAELDTYIDTSAPQYQQWVEMGAK